MARESQSMRIGGGDDGAGLEFDFMVEKRRIRSKGEYYINI